jgi:hypothetical protein
LNHLHLTSKKMAFNYRHYKQQVVQKTG